MSLSSSLSVARASTHVLAPRAPAAVLSRVTVPVISANTTPPSSLATSKPPTTPSAPASSIPVAPQPAVTRIWFNSTNPQLDLPMGDPDSKEGRPDPDNERKVKLGKTLRILQERLPTLLESPLPHEILAPNISLHLFPSTHPYLPTVSGRVAYIAALWTSPIAWNRVPIVGNVRLEILSERMVSQPVHFSPRRPGAHGEQLVVRWRTASSSSSSSTTSASASSSSADTEGTVDEKKPSSLAERGEHNLDAHLRGSLQTADEDEKRKAFTGLFLFEFDGEGRIISHTIEHVDESGEWEKGVGARVVGLTDWLLGGIKGRSDGGLPALCEIAGGKKGREGPR